MTMSLYRKAAKEGFLRGLRRNCLALNPREAKLLSKMLQDLIKYNSERLHQPSMTHEELKLAHGIMNRAKEMG